MTCWKTTTLGAVVELQRGFDLPEHKRRPGRVPVIGSAGPTGWHDTALVNAPGIVVGRAGASAGVATYVNEPFWPHNATLFVKSFKGNDPRFLFYLLQTLPFRDLNSGAAQPMLNRNYAYQLPVRVPDVLTQKRIASILAAYDDLIEVNRRRIAVLEEMARRVFEEWFVHFRFPKHAECTMIETADGPLPASWRRGVLGDLIGLAYGRALKADTRTPGDVPVIGSSGVVGWHNEALVKGPGIIVGRKGNVGAIIWSPSDFYPIDTVFYVETSQPLLFVLHQLRRLVFLNSDAAVPGLNRNAALSIRIVVPPDELMTKYHVAVLPMLDLAEQLRSSNARLAETRDLLLPRLLSGALSVITPRRDLEAVA
jgi:type I restriction enzyme S subunit